MILTNNLTPDSACRTFSSNDVHFASFSNAFLFDGKQVIHPERLVRYENDMSLIIDGVMTLPCSVTLKDVLYPFHIETEVKISNDDENLEEYVKIIQNSIDILPIIWQNIALEIPLKVVSDDVSDTPTSGDGWKLVSLDD